MIGMSRNAYGNWERGEPTSVTNAYMERLQRLMAGESLTPATENVDTALSLFAEELRALARVLESSEVSVDFKVGRFRRFVNEISGGVDDYIAAIRGE
jgi:transcriptional regulator with XRE-family HTH domain